MPVQPSSELEQLAQEAHAAYERGDDEWFKAHLSAHNPIMLGSDPDEQMIGADAVTESTTEELANRDQYAFKAMPPRIIDARSRDRSVGRSPNPGGSSRTAATSPSVDSRSCIERTASGRPIAGVAAPAISNELLRPGSPVTQPARAPA